MNAKIVASGSYNNTKNFLKKMAKLNSRINYDAYGRRGVELLRESTPVNDGSTKSNWGYTIKRDKNRVSIIFSNSDVTSDGTPVIILLQYGHSTRGNGYVTAVDVVNPPMDVIFEEFVRKIEMEVNS